MQTLKNDYFVASGHYKSKIYLVSQLDVILLIAMLRPKIDYPLWYTSFQHLIISFYLSVGLNYVRGYKVVQ